MTVLDAYQRNITYLRLSVTDLCNFRCQYCMPAHGVPKRDHSEICSVEELIEIAEAAVACGIRKIRLTGGEPLIRPGIVDICKGIGKLPGLEELCITTNGSLLDSFAKPLKEAGVSRLNISLDTLDPEKFAAITRCGELGAVCGGLRAAEEAGFDAVKLNAVLWGGMNQGDIPALVELTKDKDIELRFIELMPIGECAGWDKACFLSTQAVLDACPALIPIETQGVAERYRMPGYRGAVGLIRPVSHLFCGDCNRIRVTADGMLKPCLHSHEEYPLRGLHGDALREAIAQGIAKKPQQHHMNEHGSDSARPMNRIGG